MTAITDMTQLASLGKKAKSALKSRELNASPKRSRDNSNMLQGRRFKKLAHLSKLEELNFEAKESEQESRVSFHHDATLITVSKKQATLASEESDSHGAQDVGQAEAQDDADAQLDVEVDAKDHTDLQDDAEAQSEVQADAEVQVDTTFQTKLEDEAEYESVAGAVFESEEMAVTVAKSKADEEEEDRIIPALPNEPQQILEEAYADDMTPELKIYAPTLSLEEIKASYQSEHGDVLTAPVQWPEVDSFSKEDIRKIQAEHPSATPWHDYSDYSLQWPSPSPKDANSKVGASIAAAQSIINNAQNQSHEDILEERAEQEILAQSALLASQGLGSVLGSYLDSCAAAVNTTYDIEASEQELNNSDRQSQRHSASDDASARGREQQQEQIIDLNNEEAQKDGDACDSSSNSKLVSNCVIEYQAKRRVGRPTVKEAEQREHAQQVLGLIGCKKRAVGRPSTFDQEQERHEKELLFMQARVDEYQRLCLPAISMVEAYVSILDDAERFKTPVKELFKVD